ncbi:MAG: NAD(P)/FAD-dependent oxidoreductase [Thermoleophilaceae bacterium]|jgi:cation diffusion facilitator CzcD-associated flavoprotein CzcO|nr:NAD(P)/FAD-dependent oxidoreductase [Thermoleophilaceae bacterium]
MRAISSPALSATTTNGRTAADQDAGIATGSPTASDHAAGGAPEHARVVIVGGGFSGMGMAIQLKQAGIEDFVVLERDDDVGGTWWANTYPGCACDIPSHLYSYSFAMNPDWSRTYSPQPEIRDYLLDVADRYDLRRHVRFGAELTDAVWDDEARRWHIESSHGPFVARFLVAAMGPLSAPSIPELPGMESFEGTTFHSAGWNHDHDLRGRRVAVVGTGASAVQFVPEIQADVEQLYVFQRTPPWVLPHPDRKVSKLEKRLYRRFPILHRLVRGGIYVARESMVPGFILAPRLMRLLERLSRRHLRKHVPDPELRERLTPEYTLGCKRILPSSKWYPAIMKPNVEIVTQGLTEVGPNWVKGEDGVQREVDTIIFGTGFLASEQPWAKLVRGKDGRPLAEHWEDEVQSYRGTTVAGFPNMFTMIGPNTGLGHNSMVYMIESQLSYVMDCLRTMEERGVSAIEPRRDAQQAWNDHIQKRMERTVWTTGGCGSWYLDSQGRNVTLWPKSTFRFRRELAHFDPEEYVMHSGAPDRVPSAA